jgi:hypothetical protein
MVLNVKEGASGELAQPRCARDDFAHAIRSDFVSAEPEKFTGDALNFAHAQSETHEAGADRHQTAAHQSGETAVVVRRRDRGFCTRYFVNQCLNLVGRPLIAEEIQDNANGFFSDSTIDAGLGGQPPYQLVHLAPSSTGQPTGSFSAKIILSFQKLKYKRRALAKAHSVFNRPASVAAMQERTSNFLKVLVRDARIPTFDA